MMHGTTIVSVRREGVVALGGDGQVTMGDCVVKNQAKKVRVLSEGRVLAGFAGSTADAFMLFDLFEQRLDKHQGHLLRSAVELAKDWRSDKILRRLEALMLVADAQTSLMLTGAGDVIEPEDGLMAIGSGGEYARAAARALMQETSLGAEAIVSKSLTIAADVCVYTNHHHTLETLGA